jgi:MOSC domain-containing protein YiiM
MAPLDHAGGNIPSGIRKTGRSQCEVTVLGLDGDEHGDRANHGGSDKALCGYPSEHFDHWSRALARSFGPGSFGENLTLAGLVEEDACIGDVYRLGSSVIQLSQPRQPCFRLAALHGVPELAVWVQRSGFTGFYFRVLASGSVSSPTALQLLERTRPQLTVAEANRVMHRDKKDLAAAERLLVPELSARWRASLEKRLADGDRSRNEAARLYGRREDDVTPERPSAGRKETPRPSGLYEG